MCGKLLMDPRKNINQKLHSYESASNSSPQKQHNSSQLKPDNLPTTIGAWANSPPKPKVKFNAESSLNPNSAPFKPQSTRPEQPSSPHQPKTQAKSSKDAQSTKGHKQVEKSH